MEATVKNSVSKKVNFDNLKTSNVSPLTTVYVDENGGYITEKNFIVNGYKFHLSEILRNSIKRYVRNNIRKYKTINVCQIDKRLRKDVNTPIKEDSPQWMKIRMGQIDTLIRDLIKMLRFSNSLNEDLDEILGLSEWDKVFDMFGDCWGNQIIDGIKDEWEKDYDAPYDPKSAIRIP